VIMSKHGYRVVGDKNKLVYYIVSIRVQTIYLPGHGGLKYLKKWIIYNFTNPKVSNKNFLKNPVWIKYIRKLGIFVVYVILFAIFQLVIKYVIYEA